MILDEGNYTVTLASAPDAPLDLILARSENEGSRLVAGVLVARSERTHTCWLAAMDRNARHLAPSVAAYRAVIEHACAAGAERLLLGASGTKSARIEGGAIPARAAGP